MNGKPKVTRSTRRGQVGEMRWEAEVDKWEGGKYAISSLVVWNEKGEPLRRHFPQEASHETLELLDLEAENLVRTYLR